LRARRPSPNLSILIALAFFVLKGAPASAQQPAPAATTSATVVDSAKPVGGFAANLPTPVSPALVVLSVAPDKAVQPTSLNGLATSLVNGVDKDGRVQSGVALDVTPFMVWGAKHVSRNTYVDNPLVRVLARTSLSLATTKASSGSSGSSNSSSSSNNASKAIQAALGINVTLVDLGDRRTDLTLGSCLVNASALTTTSPKPNFTPPPRPNSSVSAEEQKKLDDAAVKAANELATKMDAALVKGAASTCRDSGDKRLWNRSAIAAGFAQTWQSPTGLAGDLAKGGQAFWLSGAYGFEGIDALKSLAQTVFYLQRKTGALAASDSGMTAATAGSAQTSVGVRVRVGTGSTAVSIDESRVVTGGTNTTSTKWSTAVSVHQHVSGDAWLTFAAGAEARPGLTGRQVFVLDSLSWSYGAK